MGATYTRQSTYADGDTITAAHTNDEFDQLLAAFASSSGHTHDGTAAEGGPITSLLGNTLTFGAATSGTDITITFDGESNDGVLKWMEDEDYFEFSDDILVASTEKLQFRDTAIYINSSTDGQLDLVADTEIQIAATTIDINGNVEISGTTAQVGVLTTTATQVATGGITSGSNIVSDTDSTDDLGTTSVRWANLYVDAITATDQITATGFTGTLDGILGSGSAAAATVTTLDTSGAVNLNLTTDSTSSTSGALIVDGGVGIAKKLYVGTDLDVDGTTNLDAVDIDGAVQLDATLTIGANDQGYDVILYGDTASANITWDTSADDLIFNGASGLIVPDGQLTLGSTAVSSTAAELNLLDTASANSVVNSKAVIYGSSGELAGTLSTAAQGNVTSLGTLTALTVDDVAVNGKVITMTGSTSDTATLTAGTNGTLTIETTDAAAAAANIQITADGTAELAGTTVTLDSEGGITLDANGGTITFADDGASLGTITSSGYSGTAAVATVATTVTITDNESTNENNAIVFTSGGDLDGGNIGLESDGDLKYNPSTGTLSATNISVSGTFTTVDSVTMDANNAVVFEGSTADAHETTLTSIDATGDRTISLPNVSGTLPVLAAASTTQISSTPEELNILDGVTTTATEINLIDGDTARGTTSVASGDGILINDAGTMRMTNVDTVSTYFAGHSVGGSNIVTTGALDSGSITSGFGTIDTGSSAITTTGVITGGTVEATADTSAGDNAAIGYTAAEGLILTGQGSTSDITVKNDADAVVFTVPTGTDDILFPDGARAMFGDGSDLKISHDGSNSYIYDTGTGGLYIQGDTFVAVGSPSGETGLTYTKDGAIALYHDNSSKFATSASGVTVTGTAATDGLTVGGAAAKVAGTETIYVPATAMFPNTTAGCSDLTQVELTNGPELKVLDFDASSDENAQFSICFPKSWNEGTITYRVFFTVTGTNTGTVAWGLSGVSIADNASNNTAFGTNVVATAKAHSGTSNDLDVTAFSGAVTIANAAVDTLTHFQIMRDVSADDQTGDARLQGIQILFTTDAANDA